MAAAVMAMVACRDLKPELWKIGWKRKYVFVLTTDMEMSKEEEASGSHIQYENRCDQNEKEKEEKCQVYCTSGTQFGKCKEVMNSSPAGIFDPNESLDKSSDTDAQLITRKFPLLFIDDKHADNCLDGSVLKEGNLCDEGESALIEKQLSEMAISERNDDGEQNTGENLCQPPNAAEKLSTDEEPKPVVEQPKKRKNKTKHISVTPAKRCCFLGLVVVVFGCALYQLLNGTTFQSTSELFILSVPAGRKKRGPSKKKRISKKSKKCQTRRAMCKIPGCFLLDLEKSKQYSGKNFKQNKDELVQKIYNLFNSSVFDKKMPEKIDIGWNKKMLRTAGLCTTGETKHPKKRFAKIQIAVKVCDSADRLRDTLVHEICHAASWLLDGIRDSHGDMWQYYAKKSNMVHPELPSITRCHSYKINYKINYECTQCKSRIGRYTRSLNTKFFICAVCKGSLVELPLTRKDGTPIEPHVRPFAKYVKENYRIVQRELEGKGHGDVMKRLSQDYIANKQKNKVIEDSIDKKH
ncbi:PREDICTED: acidic repeat-containing protein [Chrysochloris asiatica]|uniref:Acidic repeat-containing protein n=1 Tax=Chrysochloris asiatica TaxID=185453 RepID=A0A9B0TTV9_CHRAS|nr:PREDICTED: acidic repeat-containing protein [Chrysochloris asiatica]